MNRFRPRVAELEGRLTPSTTVFHVGDTVDVVARPNAYHGEVGRVVFVKVVGGVETDYVLPLSPLPGPRPALQTFSPSQLALVTSGEPS